MQQVVKSEAWRLGIATNMLVMDSDCKFIRPFCARDFIAANGDPYCVMGDARQVQELSEQLRMPKIWTDWLAVSDTTRNYFRNSSPTRHSYGGAPFIWSSKVWSDLATQRLEPAGETFLDLVRQLGSELVIYGEALIAFKSISIQPHGPFFKLYLYEEEAWIDRALGIDESILAGTRMGVVNQSNWEYWTDHRRYRKSIPSRVARSLRRQIAFVRWRLQFRKSNAQRSHDSQFPSIDGVQ